MVQRRYGPPDVLELAEVQRSEPGEGEVLVRIAAASINEWDWGRLRGKLLVNRAMFGLLRPRRKHRVIGCDISGRVEAVGAGVKRLRVGDDVYGDLSQSGWGGFAEYVCADEEALALKPPGMSFEQAAATPQAGLLALQGLRMGDVGKGRRVLINGAGGGVGTFAIQMAKSAGAEVTGVDSQDKLERVRGLGADRAIDYRQEDFTESGLTYDVILEVMARRPLSDYRRALNPGGICVLVGGATSVILRATAFGSFGEKRIKLLLHKPNRMDLDRMSELFDQGTCVPVIDRSFDLTELVDAFRYYESGRHIGKVVVKIGGTIGSVGP